MRTWEAGSYPTLPFRNVAERPEAATVKGAWKRTTASGAGMLAAFPHPPYAQAQPHLSMRLADTLNLDEMPPFSKGEVAIHQLERALRLFLDEADYVCAITLAGASEEIFGKLLEKSGKEHSLGSFVKACVALGRVAHGEVWPPKIFVKMANEFRDSLKHYTDGESVTVPKEAAIEILDRAIENYWLLTGDETPLMRRFMEEVHGF